MKLHRGPTEAPTVREGSKKPFLNRVKEEKKEEEEVYVLRDNFKLNLPPFRLLFES